MNLSVKQLKGMVGRDFYAVINDDNYFDDDGEAKEVENDELLDDALFFADEEDMKSSAVDGEIVLTIQVKAVRRVNQEVKLIPLK